MKAIGGDQGRIANALLHRDYLRPINVQIKVYDDKMQISNVGGLPDEWDTEKILSSTPLKAVMYAKKMARLLTRSIKNK